MPEGLKDDEMTETSRAMDFSHDMIDVRLRSNVASLWFAFVPVFAFTFATDFGTITTVAVPILSVIGIGLILGAVASRQRVALRDGATELVVHRSVLGISWRRKRIALSDVKRLRLGWLQGEELRGRPPVGFRDRHLPTLHLALRLALRHFGWLLGEERRHLPALRLELHRGALVPVATACTASEVKAMGADLARRLDCPVVGSRFIEKDCASAAP